MPRYLLLALSCMLAMGCSIPAGNAPGDRAADTNDVYEAVFRYRLQKEPADVTAYLAVDGQNPSEDLLKRLRKEWPNLKPVSEEPKTNVLRVYVQGLHWHNGDSAELKAGYSQSTRFAPEGYFADHHLLKENGKWVVKKLTNETMS